jgi:RNA polymerase sigma-70 factor (ECF subfamily)
MAVARPDETSTETPECETIQGLFAALESPLLSYALRLLHDRALAEDAVQEAFVRLHAHFPDVRDRRAWLYRTVHNLALNERRRDQRIVPLTSSADDSPGPGADLADAQLLPDEAIVRWESIGLVRLSLDALDERSRQLVHMKFSEDLSYKEMSARTGLTVGHVGYLLHHALKTIATELAKTGVVP